MNRSLEQRAYYAMFFAARAALRAEGFAPRTHRGVVTLFAQHLTLFAQHLTLFAQHLVKTARVEPETLTALRDALDARLLSEYDDDLSASREQSEAIVRAAHAFVERIGALLDA